MPVEHRRALCLAPSYGWKEVYLAVLLHLLQEAHVRGLAIDHHCHVWGKAVVVAQEVYDAWVGIFQALDYLAHRSAGDLHLGLP